MHYKIPRQENFDSKKIVADPKNSDKKFRWVGIVNIQNYFDYHYQIYMHEDTCVTRGDNTPQILMFIYKDEDLFFKNQNTVFSKICAMFNLKMRYLRCKRFINALKLSRKPLDPWSYND